MKNRIFSHELLIIHGIFSLENLVCPPCPEIFFWDINHHPEDLSTDQMVLSFNVIVVVVPVFPYITSYKIAIIR